MAREGAPREEVLEALAPLGHPGRVRFLEMPEVDVSSSLVRSRVAEGRTIEGLVGASVASYIADHGLYRERARVTSS